MNHTVPQIQAVPYGNGIRFKEPCPYCSAKRRQVRHMHSEFGHVVAHCFVESSPYRETGYILVPDNSRESLLIALASLRKGRKK